MFSLLCWLVLGPNRCAGYYGDVGCWRINVVVMQGTPYLLIVTKNEQIEMLIEDTALHVQLQGFACARPPGKPRNTLLLGMP